MKQVKSEEARRAFRDLLDEAERGHVAQILRYDRPVAVLMPIGTRAILLEAPDMPGYDELPETLAEREALPPRFHVPAWMDTCRPGIWICAVCWDEGRTTSWPCKTAREHGGEVFAERVRNSLGRP